MVGENRGFRPEPKRVELRWTERFSLKLLMLFVGPDGVGLRIFIIFKCQRPVLRWRGLDSSLGAKEKSSAVVVSLFSQGEPSWLLRVRTSGGVGHCGLHQVDGPLRGACGQCLDARSGTRSLLSELRGWDAQVKMPERRSTSPRRCRCTQKQNTGSWLLIIY